MLDDGEIEEPSKKKRKSDSKPNEESHFSSEEEIVNFEYEVNMILSIILFH